MKPSMTKMFVPMLMAVMVVGLLILSPKAEARGGFGGGSFRGGSFEGARGGQAAWGPRGGVVAQGPQGVSAVRSPYGGAVVTGPGGAAAVTGPYGATAVRGPQGNVGAGYRVSAIPVTATAVVIAGQTYYVADNVYYQQVFDGSEVVYIVVPAPPQ